jgi:hypothetical protein
MPKVSETNILAAINEGLNLANNLMRTSYKLKHAKYSSENSNRHQIYTLIAYHAAIFHHKQRLLRRDDTLTEKVFEVSAVRRVNKNHLRVLGQVWANIRLEDMVFAYTESSILVDFQISAIFFNNQRVPELQSATTAEIILEQREQIDILEQGFIIR